MSRAVTEEDVIRHAQHLDLIYSKSDTLYDIIPQAPRPSNETPRPAAGPHDDGVIGFVSSSVVNQIVKQLVQLAIAYNPASLASAMTSTTSSAQSTDVNSI